MTEYEAIKINAKYKNENRVANNSRHLENVKKTLIKKQINFTEHLTHLNVKIKDGTLIYYQTGTIMLKGKKITKNKFWEIIEKGKHVS